MAGVLPGRTPIAPQDGLFYAAWVVRLVMLSCLSVGCLLAATPLWAEIGRIPDPNEDFTAHRIDTEVFGWNKDFTEMAAMGIDVHRGHRSEHRGEGFMVVFKVGSITPIHNVKVLHITQAAMPHDPLPLDDVRDKLWGIDFAYQRLWPKRPKRKWFKGAMRIEPLWVPVEMEPRICRPAVGFRMEYRGAVRYQAHEMMKMKASCSELRMTDQRTYWAKADLGAVMMRFDYSPSRKNEQSIRFPLSVAWHLGQSLNIVLETGYGESAAETKKARQALSKYGKVHIKVRTQKAGRKNIEIIPGDNARLLAEQVRHDFDGEVVMVPPEEHVDLVVRIGPIGS